VEEKEICSIIPKYPQTINGLARKPLCTLHDFNWCLKAYKKGYKDDHEKFLGKHRYIPVLPKVQIKQMNEMMCNIPATTIRGKPNWMTVL